MQINVNPFHLILKSFFCLCHLFYFCLQQIRKKREMQQQNHILLMMAIKIFRGSIIKINMSVNNETAQLKQNVRLVAHLWDTKCPTSGPNQRTSHTTATHLSTNINFVVQTHGPGSRYGLNLSLNFQSSILTTSSYQHLSKIFKLNLSMQSFYRIFFSNIRMISYGLH